MIKVYAFKFNSLCQNLTFLIIFVHFLVNLFVPFLCTKVMNLATLSASLLKFSPALRIYFL